MTNPDSILCLAVVPLGADAVRAAQAGQPVRFVYLPKGKTEITAWVNGRPRTFAQEVFRDDATALQAALMPLKTKGSAPFGDFNHEGKIRAYEPLRFFWDDAKGVMIEALLTRAGAEAIAGGDLPYHSPAYARHPKTGRVIGLTGRNVGGLVAEPAFQNLEKIAARHAAGAAPQPTGGDEPPQPNQETHTMKNAQSILTVLAAASLLSATEADADNAADLLRDRINARAPKDELERVRASLAAAEAKLQATRETHAQALVAEAVKAGRLAPKDDAANTFWVNALSAEDNAGALAALNGLPVAFKAPAQIIHARAGDREGAEASDDVEAAHAGKVLARANAIRAAEGVDFDTAWTRAEAELE